MLEAWCSECQIHLSRAFYVGQLIKLNRNSINSMSFKKSTVVGLTFPNTQDLRICILPRLINSETKQPRNPILLDGHLRLY